MEKTIALLGVQWNVFHQSLEEIGTFYLISRVHNQPIKRPDCNEVLYSRASFSNSSDQLWSQTVYNEMSFINRMLFLLQLSK